MKKIFLSLLVVLLPMVAMADAVEIDGIYYNLISKAKEAEVTSNPNKYSGSVDIPTSVTFNGVEYRVTSIGRDAFRDCSSLTSVTISNYVTSIGRGSFFSCVSLTSVTIPNSVTRIEESAFYNCRGLTSVTIPNSVTSIGVSAFYNCSSLTSVTIPNSVTSIESGTFTGCSGLTSVTIPNSVTSIGAYVFEGCTSLTSVTIPNSVTLIGDKAFASCTELIDVYCLAEKVPSTKRDAFQGSYIEYATLHVPAASINAYSAAEPWKNFKSIVSYDGSEKPETPKCATPTISYRNGELTYECETEGAEFVSTINDTDIKTHYDAKIQLSATYVITVYATKSGYDNSDVATATLCWIDQQPETEGIAEGLAQIPARPVLIKADCGLITIDGAADGTPILLFTTDGTLAASTTSQGGTATLAPHLPSGTAAIVRIGERSVKVVAK